MQQTHILTKKDIEQLFAVPEKPKAIQAFFKETLEWALLVLAIFVTVYLILNWPALAINVKYYFNHGSEQAPTASQQTDEVISPIFLPSDEKISQQLASVDYLPNDRIYINKISVNAPIIWNVPEDKIIDELKNGVVHFQNTALPDQEKGNIFISGHSSGYWWSKDLYNQVFALLDQTENSDKIYLTYNNKYYTYEIFNKTTVSPKQVDVLKSSIDEPMLSLMTCVPIGTNLNRLIVQAKMVSVQNIKQSEATNVTPAPNISPTIENDQGMDKPKIVESQPQKYEVISNMEISPPTINFLPDVR
jgi:LPXTG-site transpeptidase (sortase) family protein